MSYLDKIRKGTSIESTRKAFEEQETREKGKFGDSRFWKPSVDKDGNGEATFRFLPCDPERIEETTPFVAKKKHFFKGKSLRVYSENCPKTIGKDCPVCDANIEVYRKYYPDKVVPKKICDGRFAKENYYSNIYMIDDSINPENNGKVFLYEFGYKIFNMLKEADKPASARKQAINPFSVLEDGSNFVLVSKTDPKSKQRSYDSSFFESNPSMLVDDESKIEEIMKSTYSLQSLVSEENFKPYDELQAKLDKVDNIASRRSVEDESCGDDNGFKGDVDEVNDKNNDDVISIDDLDVDDLPF